MISQEKIFCHHANDLTRVAYEASVCVVTYATKQGSVGFGFFDLGQVLGECVLMFGLFIVCFVI